MSLIEILKARWYVFIAIFGIIILLLVWSGYFSFIGGESISTMSLYESNESFIPQRHTITLTEENFKEFPQLASIIRDKTTKPTVINSKGVRSYDVPFSSNGYSRFISRYWSDSSGYDNKSWPPRKISEYNGKYYEYGYPVIH